MMLHPATTVTDRYTSWSYLSHIRRLFEGIIFYSTKHSKWLLILDNADDLTLLLDFLPPSLGEHLLLTTRARATGRLAHRLEIETLQPEQGALFLLHRAGFLASDAELSQISSQEQELALQISQEMGGLPLALNQAGAYIKETQCGLNQYLQRYRTRRSVLMQCATFLFFNSLKAGQDQLSR
jgi:hypothetical protein